MQMFEHYPMLLLKSETRGTATSHFWRSLILGSAMRRQWLSFNT